jgi:hypothetical protein
MLCIFHVVVIVFVMGFIKCSSIIDSNATLGYTSS